MTHINVIIQYLSISALFHLAQFFQDPSMFLQITLLYLLFYGWIMCVHAKWLQLCLTSCDPMDCSLPGSSARGILQARILEWVSMPFSRRFSWPRDGTHVSCISRKIIYHLSQGSLQLLHSIGFSLTSLVKLGGLFSVWSSLKWECSSEFCLRLFSPFLIPHSTIFWKFCSHGLCDSNYLVHICSSEPSS